MREIADFMGTTAWLIFSRIFPRWRSFPPRTLTLSGAPELELTYARQLEDELLQFLPRRNRISRICGDRMYGGPMETGCTVYFLITRILPRSREIFVNVVRLDMLEQATTIRQVAKLFSPANSCRFPMLERASFLICPDKRLFDSTKFVAEPPARLHTLEFQAMCTTSHNIRLPLMPLLLQIQHLTWLPEAPHSEEELSAYPQLTFLETFVGCLGHNLQEKMPNLKMLICHMDNHVKRCFHFRKDISEDQVALPRLPYIERIVRVPLPDPNITEVLYFSVPSIRTKYLEPYRYLTSFHVVLDWNAKSFEEVVDVVETCVLPVLGNIRYLEEVTFPKEVIFGYSDCIALRPRLAAIGSKYRFSKIRRLNFGPVELTSESDGGNHAAADEILPLFLQMFPNLQVLAILEIQLHLCVTSFLHLERMLPRLRKLCLGTSMNFPYEAHLSSLSRWMPHCRNLDVFVGNVYNTSRWNSEWREGGLLDIISRNQSLRFVLIHLRGRSNTNLPVKHDIQRLAERWGDRNWRCVLFFHPLSVRVVGAVKTLPKSRELKPPGYTIVSQSISGTTNIFMEQYHSLFREVTENFF